MYLAQLSSSTSNSAEFHNETFAATLREKCPDLDVDTMQGALLTYKPLQQTLELMIPYDLIVV